MLFKFFLWAAGLSLIVTGICWIVSDMTFFFFSGCSSISLIVSCGLEGMHEFKYRKETKESKRYIRNKPIVAEIIRKALEHADP